MDECIAGWGSGLYQLVRIPIRKAWRGYYLRWYYNGWHYWFFLPGEITLNTEGEKYRTTGTQIISMSSGQVKVGEIKAIRTVMNAKQIDLLTDQGWKAIRVLSGSVNIFEFGLNGAQIEFRAIVGSRAVSQTTGLTPVVDVPIVEPVPDPSICEVVIGTQVWMCSNYDVNYPGSRVYDDDEDNRELYGGLYSQTQVLSEGFAPPGWRVPTKADFEELITFLGGEAVAGGILKAIGFTYWAAPNTGAADTYGFDARGGGMYSLATGYYSQRATGRYWTTDYLDRQGQSLYLSYLNGEAELRAADQKEYHSVRLIRETPADPLSFTFTTTFVGALPLYLAGTGIVTIDWGDGSSTEQHSLGSRALYAHTFTAGTHEVTIYGAALVTWFECQMGDITAVDFEELINIEHINLTGNLLSVFQTYATWTKLVFIELQLTPILAIDTFASWVNLYYFDASTTPIASLETHPEWTQIYGIGMASTAIASIETHPEWINITALNVQITNITSLITHPEWVVFKTLGASSNAITDAAVINAMITNMRDFSTVPLRDMNIIINGGTNAAPTGTALVAKADIIAAGGICITN
jgi:uncharacterized protein (TIGR02145 family)